MTDPYPPSSQQPPPLIRKRRGLGCFATGCLIVVVVLMLLGIGIGSISYVVYHGGQAYISEKANSAKIATATDEQYQAVLEKLAPLNQVISEGRAATLEITPDDFNVLIARSPQLEFLRGRVFLANEGDRLIAEMSFPASNSDVNRMYFNGRTTVDASYASDGFVLNLRHFEPLDKEQGNTLFSRFLNRPAMLKSTSQILSQALNEVVRQQADKDPVAANLFNRLRTIVFHDGKMMITIAENPGGAPTQPTPTPTASPVATEGNQT